jgi:formylglycine-generating enzyme required for sulfatase activity
MSDLLLPPMVRIPAGSFTMGADEGQPDEAPAHLVELDAYLVGVHPVTNQEYAQFVRETRHRPPGVYDLPVLVLAGGRERERAYRQSATPYLWTDDGPPPGRDRHPVVLVTFADALAYCEWLSEATERPVRLPTEAEWERAARGGVEEEAYPWGNEVPDWIPDGGRGPLAGPWPVDLGPPNRFGVSGIAANIHEWCADWHARDYYARASSRNPAGPPAGLRRASRGGSWRHAVTISRSSARSKLDPSFRYTDYGFRVVR